MIEKNWDHIKIYRHRRVVFGVTSSPFLLGATLNHHLDNAHGNFDNVAKILRKSFYVDNCVTSFETEEQLQKFIVESKILLSSAHFNLRGWQSNVLLNPEKFSELESQPDNFETMVLGLIWNLKDDCLSCNINCQKNEVHFELITSLSTAAFLQSLRRFISRRGRPTIIYSDNGTNFVGSNSALNSIDWDVVISKANIQKIKNGKFNPPSAAWWGGFWERMIQMLKQILRKILGRASLYYEELNTVLCECEHVINSRPLTYISEDVNDLSPLTPAMFLQEIETSDVTDIDCLDHQEINKRIRHVQFIREQLRKRFRIEYLGQLREQTQHHRKLRPLTVGEVVVVENSLKNRTLWSLARVIQLIPGKDGHVRVARVKTETGEMVRPEQRLYNLELQEPDTNLPKDLTDSVIRTRRGRKLEVSEELGIAQSVISRLWQQFQDDGNVSRCYSTGCPRVTTPNEERYLAVTAKRNRRSTATDLSRQLSSATGATVSRQTVYRRLVHIGLHARRPVRCVPLTATHCRLRLTWSREHALWTSKQWSCVLFPDESRFNLQSDSRRTLIWRVPGTRYHQENTIERHRYGGAGWLVWGGIIFGSRTDLHFQSVTMTGHIYRDVILEQHVRLLRGAMGAEFLFMDYNARLHRVNIVDECLRSEDITRMDWPAYSSDFNPIEHVWDMLGRRIAARQPSPTFLPELRRALLDEWCNIP
ncbi:transposable element Tcb1 transposase [Trichonephila clavipes]|nr:transposable element Tcb1 transposase [Trichonephila clavipes]